MMFWYGSGMSGWGYVLMSVSMILFWALVIAGVVALVRYLGRSSQRTHASGGSRPAPERVLAERFARGDIDEEEYRRPGDAARRHPHPLIQS
jgi:putative membrane protein